MGLKQGDALSPLLFSFALKQPFLTWGAWIDFRGSVKLLRKNYKFIGLKQGDALSPLLFNFALEQLFLTWGPRICSRRPVNLDGGKNYNFICTNL